MAPADGAIFCRASERVKHIRQGLIGTVTRKNLSARPRDRHSPAHLKGASNEPARGAAMTSGPRSPTVCYGALDPPVGGTFHFENLVRVTALQIGEENDASYLLAHQTLRTRRVTVATKVSTRAI